MDASWDFERFSGYNATEIVGENLEKLFDSPQEIKGIEQEILEKGRILGRETTFLNKEKRKIPIILSAMVRKDKVDDFIGYFLSIMDLTAIKQAENELKKKIDELERYKNVTVGRELRLIEIKKELKELRAKLEGGK